MSADHVQLWRSDTVKALIALADPQYQESVWWQNAVPGLCDSYRESLECFFLQEFEEPDCEYTRVLRPALVGFLLNLYDEIDAFVTDHPTLWHSSEDDQREVLTKSREWHRVMSHAAATLEDIRANGWEPADGPTVVRTLSGGGHWPDTYPPDSTP